MTGDKLLLEHGPGSASSGRVRGFLLVGSISTLLAATIWLLAPLRLHLSTTIALGFPWLTFLILLTLLAFPSPLALIRLRRKTSQIITHAVLVSIGLCVVFFLVFMARLHERNDVLFMGLLGMTLSVGLLRLSLGSMMLRSWVKAVCRRNPRAELLFEAWACFSGCPRRSSSGEQGDVNLSYLSSNFLRLAGRVAKKIRHGPLVFSEIAADEVRKQLEKRAHLVSTNTNQNCGVTAVDALIQASLAEVELTELEMAWNDNLRTPQAPWIGRLSETALLLHRMDRLDGDDLSHHLDRFTRELSHHIKGNPHLSGLSDFMFLCRNLLPVDRVSLTQAEDALRHVLESRDNVDETGLFVCWLLGIRLLRQDMPQMALKMISAVDEASSPQLVADLRAQILGRFLDRGASIDKRALEQTQVHALSLRLLAGDELDHPGQDSEQQ